MPRRSRWARPCHGGHGGHARADGCHGGYGPPHRIRHIAKAAVSNPRLTVTRDCAVSPKLSREMAQCHIDGSHGPCHGSHGHSRRARRVAAVGSRKGSARGRGRGLDRSFEVFHCFQTFSTQQNSSISMPTPVRPFRSRLREREAAVTAAPAAPPF